MAGGRPADIRKRPNLGPGLINYVKAEWKGLIRYTEDGKYRVDNNAAESIMRELACGRKNCSQPVA